MKKNLVLCLGVTLFSTISTQAKTFKVTNPSTGQTLEVSCIFPSSVECKQKIEEAKQRVMKGLNPSATTLSGARWQDRANGTKAAVASGYESTRDTIKSGAQASGEYITDKAQTVGGQIRGGLEATGGFIGDKAQAAGNSIRSGAQATGEFIGDKAQAAGSAIRGGAEATGNFIRDGYDASKETLSGAAGAVRDGASSAYRKGSEVASSAAEALQGKTYKMSIPGIEHSMSFYCRGGLESDECKKDQKEAEAAIRSGSTLKTLTEYRVAQGAQRTGEAVANGAHRAVRSTANFLDRMSIKTCQQKLKRYAKEFDEQYSNSGQEHLVSYKDKMSFIKQKLIEENYFESCESSFENAVLGNQLKIASGKVETENTHIFDGLGRLPNGGVGYWKNEDRVESYEEFNQTISQ